MHWYILLTFTIALSLCNSVLSQESDIEKNIKKSGFDASAKLLQLLYKKNNVFYSPFNIRLALAAVHLGADGNTRDELANFLGLPKDATKIQQAHEVLSQLLRKTENTTEVGVYTEGGWKDVKATIINNANGVFVQKGLNLVPSYASQIQSYYKGEVANVDFANDPSKATDTVNEFVSKGTNGRIPKLFTSPLDRDLSVLLAATLYFKASWDEPFHEDSTKEETFNTGSGNALAKLMHSVDDVPYINLPKLQAEAISLKYTGGDASIYIVLPYKSQSLDAVVSALNGDVLQEIIKDSKYTYVDYKIPKTKYKWSEDLNEPLQKLGVNDLFSNKAKLNNIVKEIALKVSKVTHAAEIEINEKGTEASAVTVIKMVPMSAVFHPEPIQFTVDRPFLFFINHHATNTILFAGTVHNPAGQ